MMDQDKIFNEAINILENGFLPDKIPTFLIIIFFLIVAEYVLALFDRHLYNGLFEMISPYWYSKIKLSVSDFV